MRRPAPPPDVDAPAGYRELIRHNVHFRRLWTGNLVSLLGDWFNTIALYTLVSQLTMEEGSGGSPIALAAVFIFKMLPWAVASPLAGLIADRFNRRRLMIATDLLRAVVVLGFLGVDTPDELPWLYVLITLQVVIGAFFQPAKSASLPNITTPRELLTANALSSATWSVMLAVGAAAGGLATEWLGPQTVFLLDSATYLVSAWFIYRTEIPQHTDAPPRGPVVRTALREIWDGWAYLRSEPRVGRIALAKATWAVAGGGMVFMLALLGDRVTPSALAAGIGLLFMARGIGTGIGPVVARRLFQDAGRWPLVLGACVAFSGICYAAVGAVPWFPWREGALSLLLLIGLIVAAHASSGANWVLSAVLLQQRTPDRFRGRVFATEWLLVMLCNTLSTLVAGLLLEASVLTLRQAFWAFGLVQVACGGLWLLLVVPRERQEVLAPEQD
ncbi:MAG: MFS transporter [Bacteroidetes bacterium]|nr:MAG: MFS transporter [Bacteroidota bacterium]